MSNYSAPTRHPVTGAIEMADWLDDHDGKHRYGVRFPSDGKIYGGHECVEVKMTDDIVKQRRLRIYNVATDQFTVDLSKNEAADEIERLRAALGKVMQKCPYARKDQWCAGLDCACVIIRAALEGEASDDAAT